LNRLELEQDEQAGSGLRRMEEILNAPSPYCMLYEAEGLIRSVSEVNTVLIEGHRQEAAGKIAALMEEVSKELETISADANLRSQCLRPLEGLRDQILKQESIAHLTQAEQEAVRALDGALEKIEAFIRKPPVKEHTANDLPVKKTKPIVKPRCIVKPAELVAATYLETSKDIEKFLSELRERLTAAIRAGQRIQIR